jgi:hypothetical protein
VSRVNWPDLGSFFFPFSTTAPLDAEIATSVVNLALGVAAGTLVGGVAARSVSGRGRASRSPVFQPYDHVSRL